MADPKFQFSRRWPQIVPRLLSKNPEEVTAATADLEMNMRDEEDAWAAGSTLKSSFLAVADNWQSASGSGNSTPAPFTDLAFAVPSDSTFTYYLDWFVKAGDLSYANAGGNFWMRAFAQIQEQSPGAGFEKWGFQAFTPDGAVASASPFGRLVVGGYGHRCESISPTLLGTTIHLQVYLNIQSTVGTWNWNLGYGAKLLAIPN